MSPTLYDRFPVVPVLTLLALASAGCAASEVQGKFVASESCPADRVRVTQIGRVDPPPVDVPPPPPDIAADRARAAVYYENRRAEANTSRHKGQRVFLAQGCGQRETYVCDFSDGDTAWCERDDRALATK